MTRPPLRVRAAGVLRRGRAMAEGLQVDACTVVHPDDAPRPYDPVTFEYSSPAPAGALRYQGPCQVKQQQGAQYERPNGEQVSTLVSYVVKLPVTATGIAEGDLVTVSAAELDPDITAEHPLQLVVRAVNRGTRLTSRRLVCTEFA